MVWFVSIFIDFDFSLIFCSAAIIRIANDKNANILRVNILFYYLTLSKFVTEQPNEKKSIK